MGFKYKKFEIRSGEVVEPTRIRDNMQSFAHEINGNIDRENLPLACIDNDSIVNGTFNSISTSFSTGSSADAIILTDLPAQFTELTDMTLTKDVPVDCLVVVHWGAHFEWIYDTAALLATFPASGGTAFANWTSQDFFSATHYDLSGNFYLDFLLKINGQTVSQCLRNPFFKKIHSGYMTGALPVTAGQATVSVEAKLYRNEYGKGITKCKEFDVHIFSRNLIVQLKKR